MFQFKQFTIHQKYSTQKVSEVACIFGAQLLMSEEVKEVLDIGSGSGLLTLMLAQRFRVHIDAVELDELTFEEGKRNIASSPFHASIHCFHADIKDFQPNKVYDFILSNPPFFENQLQADTVELNLAKHSISLTLSDLMNTISRLLAPEGNCCLLLPVNRETEIIALGEKNQLYASKQIHIKHTDRHKAKVGIYYFSRMISKPGKTELIIKNEEGKYTGEMKNLLREYYLNVD